MSSSETKDAYRGRENGMTLSAEASAYMVNIS